MGERTAGEIVFSLGILVPIAGLVIVGVGIYFICKIFTE